MAKKVTRIRINHNPYTNETIIWTNEIELRDKELIDKSRIMPFGEWLDEFAEYLISLNAYKLSILFCGVTKDWTLVKNLLSEPKLNKMLKKPTIRFKPGVYYKDFVEDVSTKFADLRRFLLIDDPNNEVLIQEYEKTRKPFFRINVVATMSSGKSTLINALLGKKLLPSRNEACTSTIIEILDTDQNSFAATVLDSNNNVIESYQNELNSKKDICAEDIDRLNQDPTVARISLEGDIPFAKATGTALMLVDTPGTNNAQDDTHQNMTYQEICKDDRSIILYVLNATQLKANDDDVLLRYVSEQIRQSNTEIENRILFVVNKMDCFDPDAEDVEKTILSIKEYLKKHGITKPRIFTCSAVAALQARTNLKSIDINTITKEEEKRLPYDAREALYSIDKIMEYEKMHLEKYATVSPTIRREMDNRLKNAIKEHNIHEQILIHSGIYSLEKYISLYINVRTVKDLMDFLENTLEKSII